MICPYCRKEIKNTAKFCNYCGKPVSQSADIVPAAQNFPVEPRPAEAKKRKRGGAGKWVLLILVLLVVAGGAFYGLVTQGIISISEEDPATTIPEETTTVWLLTSITEDGSNITYSLDYDSRGNLVSMVRNGDDSEIRYEYSVGSNDEILERVTYSHGEKGPSTKYSYDSNGNVTEERTFSSDGTTVARYNKYSYDNAGNNIETMLYLKDGTVGAQCIYSYNPEGQIIKSEYFGSFNDWSEYSYSTDGLLVKCTNYEEDGTLRSWYEYSFDKDGNLLEYSGYDDDGTKWFWCRYVYDSWGNMISVKDYNSDGSVNDEITLRYTEMQIPVDSQAAGMSSLEQLARIKAEGVTIGISVAGIDYY